MNLTTKIRDINPHVVTLPEYFRNQGYYAAGVEKIFDHRNVDSKEKLDEESWSEDIVSYEWGKIHHHKVDTSILSPEDEDTRLIDGYIAGKRV